MPPEVKKPVQNVEHKPAPKPVVEIKKPEIQAPKPKPEFVETPKPVEHSELKHELKPELQHEATVKKPVQPVLTLQQKIALQKKKQAEEKKRLEEEKTAKPPQQ